ncbi:MAG: hypothetical protein K6U08_03180, partial [Firmicutes bacterium]|nr:hypothetical protein [Bacillota bacterium]
ISADHEGQDGLERLEDLAFVKALVVEAVARDGYAVLNAGDPFVHGMAGRARGQVVYFSRTAENLVVRKHLLRGGRAVFRAGDALVLHEGGSTRAMIPLAEVPFTVGGLLGFQVENAAAAAAAVWSLGLPVSVIRRALRTFGRPDLGDGYAANPGRFQLWRQGGRTIVLDYGHNRAAYVETLGTVRRLAEGDVLSVVGAPGDRLDAHLVEMGRLAARSSDYVYIKEDVDTRGRARGEVASLFLKGVLDIGFPEARVEVVLDERAALERALTRAAPGDWVVVFYEKDEPLRDYLLGLGARAVCPARLAGARVRERAPGAGGAEAVADAGGGETPGDSRPSEGTAPTARPVPLSGEGGSVQG